MAKKVFDLFAKDYDEWFDSARGKALFSSEVEAVKFHMKDIEKPFLEIGVGTGRFAEALGIKCGIEPSRSALEMAAKRGIDVKEAKGENLPFADDSFGAVFLLFTLCFVESPDKVISEAKRVLKNRGALISGIINRESEWGRLYLKKKEEGHLIYSHADFFRVEDVTELYDRHRFKDLHYSSTLIQRPSETPGYETPQKKLVPDAGFICISGRK